MSRIWNGLIIGLILIVTAPGIVIGILVTPFGVGYRTGRSMSMGWMVKGLQK